VKEAPRRAENRGQATVDELVEVNLSIDQESRLTYSSPSPPCEACVIAQNEKTSLSTRTVEGKKQDILRKIVSA
jgi:hypothetical protein